MIKQVPLKSIFHLALDTVRTIMIQLIKTIASKKMNSAIDTISPRQANTPITIQEMTIVFTFLEAVEAV